jgi:hypothetical protein
VRYSVSALPAVAPLVVHMFMVQPARILFPGRFSFFFNLVCNHCVGYQILFIFETLHVFLSILSSFIHI